MRSRATLCSRNTFASSVFDGGRSSGIGLAAIRSLIGLQTQ
jgi:hypothetical protein